MTLDEIKSRVPLNFELLANPYNWVIVVLMILTAGLALAYIFPQSTEVSE